MNKRMRKKQLKKLNKYVNPRETWCLDCVIAEFVLPRLQLFKKLNNGYPGQGDMDTPEKWDIALDKMIRAFQLVIDMDNLDDRYWNSGSYNHDLWTKEQNEKMEGLQLFAIWFDYLWW